MRVVVCALAKNEHLYINEWIKHYIGLGVDTIYIYDNDELDSPYIKDYIDKDYLDKVVIKNIRGFKRDKLQHDIYTGFYNKYGKGFDWCIFCDIDEYLVGIKDVKEFLSKDCFKDVEQIRIRWKLYGDDNLVERDMTKGVQETFKKEVKKSLNRDLITKGNLEIQGKMIVKGGLEGVIIRSPHFASKHSRDNILKSVLPSGRPCNSKVAIEEDYSHENVFMNHYMTKTISEFVKQKMNRTDAVYGKRQLDLDYFWRINKKTKEKLDWLKANKVTIN